MLLRNEKSTLRDTPLLDIGTVRLFLVSDKLARHIHLKSVKKIYSETLASTQIGANLLPSDLNSKTLDAFRF